jgi:hypothetical protein
LRVVADRRLVAAVLRAVATGWRPGLADLRPVPADLRAAEVFLAVSVFRVPLLLVVAIARSLAQVGLMMIAVRRRSSNMCL